ncbi:uncharacterized protein METZ01_LOCUS313320, partial [marine metagenome]
MSLKTAIKTIVGVAVAFGFAVFMLWVMSGFGNRQSRIKDVTSKGILLLSNGTEPEDLDPHLVTGVPEHNIISALIEGLVSEDPKDL